MSTTTPDPERPIERCRPANGTPVELDAADLESTAPEYLRDLKRGLAERDLFPAELSVTARFEEDCSLRTQREVDRIRSYVRAGAFLGVGTITVAVDDVADPEKVEPALAACVERADREGVALAIEADSPDLRSTAE